MKLKFTKMQGAGNDFVVFNACDQRIELSPEQYRLIADRRFGIGADHILIVEQPDNTEADFLYRVFNADGSEVEQCGNGARAFAKFVTAFALTRRNPIKVKTKAGLIKLRIERDGQVTVDMGKPEFDPLKIPFNAEGLAAFERGEDRAWPIVLSKKSEPLYCSVVSLGNPHTVRIVKNVDTAPVEQERPLIENHPPFSKPGERRFHGNRQPARYPVARL